MACFHRRYRASPLTGSMPISVPTSIFQNRERDQPSHGHRRVRIPPSRPSVLHRRRITTIMRSKMILSSFFSIANGCKIPNALDLKLLRWAEKTHLAGTVPAMVTRRSRTFPRTEVRGQMWVNSSMIPNAPAQIEKKNSRVYCKEIKINTRSFAFLEF